MSERNDVSLDRDTQSPSLSQSLVVRYWSGFLDYEPIFEEMRKYTDERDNDSDDQIWVLQHTPVFTQGQAGKPEHVLFAGDIPVVNVDRGGQVTYHGPGQLVIYLLFDIERMGIGARELVTRIEDSIVDSLALYGIKSESRKDAPGVYVEDKKIGSIGLRIRKGRSYHGLSVNVDMDLEPFSRINPCGYEGMKMTQLSNFENAEPIEQFSARVVDTISKMFGYQEILMEYSESL